MTVHTTAALVAALAPWVDELWPDPQRGQALLAALGERFGTDPRPVTAAVCREVEAVAAPLSRHLALQVHDSPAEPDRVAQGWPPQDAGEVRVRAAFVRGVTRRPDGVAVLALDGLDGVHLAAPYLEAAFALARGAAGVVLDLRRNGGGDPATVALVLDWVLGPTPTRISEVHYRDRTRQWWTSGRPPERALPPGTPLGVLTGAGTFSSGEALAYHLQHLCGAVVVGEVTRGAADHITPVRVTPTVTAYLPEAYVVDATTGTNWEATGVVPDVPCAASDPGALDRALEVAAGQVLAGRGRSPARAVSRARTS